MSWELSLSLADLLAAGGGAAAVSYGVFRYVGIAWLDSKFSEKLEAFRHEKAKELEKLRAEISGSLDVTMRLQERQFAAITDCWQLVNEAHGFAMTYTNPFQTFSNLSSMSDEMKSEYIESFDFMKSQKNEILGAKDPDIEFSRLISATRKHDAEKAVSKLNNEIHRNEIFIENDILQKFFEINELIRTNIISHKIAEDGRRSSEMVRTHNTISKECVDLIMSLSKDLRRIIVPNTSET